MNENVDRSAAVEMRDEIARALAKADHWEAAGNAVWAANWRLTAERLEARLAGLRPSGPVRRTDAEKAAVYEWSADYREARREENEAAFYERASSYEPRLNVFHDDYGQVIASAGGDRLIVTPNGSLYVLQEACAERGWRSYQFFDGAGPARAYLIAVAVGLDPVLADAAAFLPDNPKDALRR